MEWILGLFGGAGISFIVSLLKRIPVIGKYPKLFAALLGVIMEAVNVGLFAAPAGIIAILTQLVTLFSTSVATYEVVSKPVANLSILLQCLNPAHLIHKDIT